MEGIPGHKESLQALQDLQARTPPALTDQGFKLYVPFLIIVLRLARISSNHVPGKTDSLSQQHVPSH